MLCYKCSQRKAVVDSKVRSRYGSYQHPASQEFEAYLYQQTPLCNQCMNVLLSNKSRDMSRDVSNQHPRGSLCSLKLVVTVVIVFLSVNFLGFFAFSLYSGGPSVSMTTLLHKVSFTLTTSKDQIHYILHSVSRRDYLSVLSSWAFPTSTDERIYFIVIVIQITTLALRQHDFLSITLSFISYAVYLSQNHILEAVPTESSYIDAARYILLILSVLRVFTKKSTVVKVSKRKNGQRPVIKVRRSPKKRDSPSAGTLFSDDEESAPQPSCSASPTPLDLSANDRTALESRDEVLTNSKATHSTPIPVKDVRSRFNVMKISGSPVKAVSPGFQVEARSSSRHHSSCIRPAKFSLQDRSPDSSSSLIPGPPVERPRFDSTETEHTAPDSLLDNADIPSVAQSDAIQMKPIILVLLLSVVTNYYLIVNYVLTSETLTTR